MECKQCGKQGARKYQLRGIVFAHQGRVGGGVSERRKSFCLAAWSSIVLFAVHAAEMQRYTPDVVHAQAEARQRAISDDPSRGSTQGELQVVQLGQDIARGLRALESLQQRADLSAADVALLAEADTNLQLAASVYMRDDGWIPSAARAYNQAVFVLARVKIRRALSDLRTQSEALLSTAEAARISEIEEQLRQAVTAYASHDLKQASSCLNSAQTGLKLAQLAVRLQEIARTWKTRTSSQVEQGMELLERANTALRQGSSAYAETLIEQAEQNLEDSGGQEIVHALDGSAGSASAREETAWLKTPGAWLVIGGVSVLILALLASALHSPGNWLSKKRCLASALSRVLVPVVHETIAKAATHGDIDDVRRHLRRGADPNFIDTFMPETTLNYAVRAKSMPVVKLLVESGADVNLRPRPDGTTALHVAAGDGAADIAEYLLESGAAVDAVDSAWTGLPAGTTGHTPLWKAACYGHTDVARVLCQHGADVNAAFGLEHQTPLDGAAGQAHVQTARLLIDMGANVDVRNYCGRTPLHAAVDSKRYGVYCGEAFEREREELIQLLLQAGADADVADKHGLTARDLAQSCEVAHLFGGSTVGEPELADAGGCGERASTDLRRAERDLQSNDDGRAYKAAELLAEDGTEDALRLLVEAMGDDYPHAFNAATWHLADSLKRCPRFLEEPWFEGLRTQAEKRLLDVCKGATVGSGAQAFSERVNRAIGTLGAIGGTKALGTLERLLAELRRKSETVGEVREFVQNEHASGYVSSSEDAGWVEAAIQQIRDRVRGSS